MSTADPYISNVIFGPLYFMYFVFVIFISGKQMLYVLVPRDKKILWSFGSFFLGFGLTDSQQQTCFLVDAKRTLS